MSAVTNAVRPENLPYPRALLLAPSVAALCYPFFLKAFTAAVTAPHGGSTVLSAVWLLLALAVPSVGIFVAAKIGASQQITAAELSAKRLALLSVAAAPIYTATGVLLYMAHDPVSDILIWVIIWGLGLLVGVRAASAASVEIVTPQTAVAPRLRVAHGASAAAILLLFLLMHLVNHLTGLRSEAAHRHVMDLFRVIYRADAIEPLVVLLFLFQVASGIALLWSYTRRPADLFRTIQIASGAYLIFFVLGHMNSVFVYARLFAHIKTDWDFATGAPTGLIKDPWNIRLLPHYLIGVFFVLGHVILGARVVALAHGVRRETADRAAKVGIFVAALAATAIIVGMSGIHLG